MSDSDLYKQILQSGGFTFLQRAHFDLTGEDRARYLNGQISNAVSKADASTSVYACVMTAKGRMSGDIYFSQTDERIRIDCDVSLRESMAARLEKYMIADDVELHDVTTQRLLIHVLAHNGDLPKGAPESLAQLTCERFGHPGLDIFSKPEHASAWRKFLGGFMPEVHDQMLESIRISAGVPVWGKELTEDTIPVEAGIAAKAVDYEKGCYIGQEVISRLKSIGSVSKSLVKLVPENDADSLHPDADLFDPADSSKPCGRITSIAYSFDLDKTIALGYLKRGYSGANMLLTTSASSQDQLKLNVLPISQS